MKISTLKSKARTECDKILNYVKSTSIKARGKNTYYNLLWKKLKSGYFQISSV